MSDYSFVVKLAWIKVMKKPQLIKLHYALMGGSSALIFGVSVIGGTVLTKFC